MITPNQERWNLRPCPFCGGKAEMHDERNMGGSYVRCSECGIEAGRASRLRHMAYCADHARSEVRWNIRSDDEPVSQLITAKWDGLHERLARGVDDPRDRTEEEA